MEGNSTKKSKIKRILEISGPGLIMAAACIGPASVTTASVLGSSYGYALLWMVILTIVVRAMFIRGAYVSSLVLGHPTLEAIRKYYGPVLGVITGIACLLGSVAYQVGNFSGTGMGVSLLFPGLDWKIGGVVMTLASVYFILSKNVFVKIEKVMKVCVFAMIACFGISLIATGGPSISGMAAGMIPKFPDQNSMFTTLAFIGSTCSLPGIVYGTYLGKEKKWGLEDIRNNNITWDTAVGVGSIGLIVILVMLTSAAVLHPRGITVTSVQDMAEQLTPIIGEAAKYLMGLSLLSAAVSSMIVNAQMGSVLILSGLGKPYGMEDKLVRVCSLAILIFGCVLGVSIGKAPVQMLMIAAACTIVSMPLLGIFIIMLLNKKEMGEFKPKPIFNATLIISYILILLVTWNNISNFMTRYL